MKEQQPQNAQEFNAKAAQENFLKKEKDLKVEIKAQQGADPVTVFKLEIPEQNAHKAYQKGAEILSLAA